MPQLGPGFVLEPQGQILWQKVSFRHDDDGLGDVDLGDTTGPSGRVGLRGKWTVVTAGDQVWQPYLRANLWRDWGAVANTLYSGVDVIPAASQTTLLQLGGGLTGRINASVSVFANIDYEFAVGASDNAKRNGLRGAFGARAQYVDCVEKLKHAVIVDVEATTTIRQAEVGAAKTMLDRTAEQFDLTPLRLVADGGYGSADMVGWLVDERGIEPHVNLIDKSERTDGTFFRSDFIFDTERDLYVSPGGKELRRYRREFSTPREGVAKDGAIRYRAAEHDCDACMLKPQSPSGNILNRQNHL